MDNGIEAVEAKLNQRRRFSVIWLLPFISLIVVVLLVWKTIHDRGLEVHVQFENAKGIKAGKTEIRYNGLSVGRVSKMTMTKDLSAVDVLIDIDRSMEDYLREGSQFWLVQPQLSVAGVSGLETLVSGNYIAFKPLKEGAKTRQFNALASQPVPGESEGGISLVLRASELSSIQEGSPVYYRRLKIGEVTRYALADDSHSVDVYLYIKPEFTHLIHQNTRFWNASGVDISGSLSNLKVRSESLVSMIQGGVSLYTPEWEDEGSLAKDGDQFPLYRDYEEAEAGIGVTIEFPLDVALGKETPRILFHGMEVGVIKSTDFNDDYSAIVAKAVIRPEAKSLLVEGARFWVVKPNLGLNGVSGLETLLGGRYIAIDVSQKHIKAAVPKLEFDGLANKPSVLPSAHGLRLTLQADSLNGISQGSPVLYRKLPVGVVESYTLNDLGVAIKLLIEPKYKHLVNESSRFWNASGVTLEGGLQGFKVHSGTLSTMLTGGIEFSTQNLSAKKITPSSLFTLFENDQRAKESGKTIYIWFESAEGLQAGTRLKYRGLDMGRVIQLSLDDDKKGIHAKVLLEETSGWLAKKGTQFWLVRPKLGLTQTANLETLVTGQYIEMRPGADVNAEPETQFRAERRSPDDRPSSNGLRLELVSSKLGSVRVNNPVYYREIPVGRVTGYKLDNPATQVVIYINIEARYSTLVTNESRFWNASGVDINFGLFSGARVRTESLEALLAGGIAFATPETGEPVDEKARFELFDKAKPEWLKWTPEIYLNSHSNF